MAIDAGVRSTDDLREFGNNLLQMGEQMYNVMTLAQRRMNYVSEGWRDDKNEEFKVRFEESVQMIKRMSEEFSEYNQYLQRQCEILEQYKSTRI